MQSICAVGAASLTYILLEQQWDDPAALAALATALTALITALAALIKVVKHQPVIDEVKRNGTGG